MLHTLLHLLPLLPMLGLAMTLKDIPGGPTAVVTAGTVPKGVPGSRFSKRMRITGDNAYPTGGYALTPALVGLSTQIDYCAIDNQHPGGTVCLWLWNTVTQKLQLIVMATGVELANGQDASLAFVDCVFTGY